MAKKFEKSKWATQMCHNCGKFHRLTEEEFNDTQSEAWLYCPKYREKKHPEKVNFT